MKDEDFALQAVSESARKSSLSMLAIIMGLIIHRYMRSVGNDTSSLQERIKKSKDANPELNYHKDNEEFLVNIMTEISMITGRSKC